MRTCVVVLVMALFVLPLRAPAKTTLVDTPSLCARVEKIKGNRVDLTVPAERCPMESPGKVSVEVGEEVNEIDIYLNGTYWKRVSTAFQPLSLGDVAETVEQSRKHSETTDLPENRHYTEATRLAEDLSRYAQSSAFQERIELERGQLYREAYGSQGDNQQETPRAPGKIGRLSPQERIYLFISSSVPVPTLRHYIQVINDLGEPNIRVVMRGFVGGARFVKPTVAFLKEILFTDPECDPNQARCKKYGVEVIIDPPLFRRYRVERVPAFVYVPSITITDSETSEGLESNRVSDHYLVHGDVSIEYALGLFSRERKSSGIVSLLAAWRGEQNGGQTILERLGRISRDEIK